MAVAVPIYRPDKTSTAWQLLWSLTVFWRSPPFSDDWLELLRQAVEPDGVRLLEHRFAQPQRSQFLLTTKSETRPVDVVQRVKGRLQYLVRDRWPKAFSRNYDLHSIGSTRRDKVEQYVASQLEHHFADDPRLKALLADLQIINPDVDLSQPRFTAHARFRCNLHLVFARAPAHREERTELHEQVRNMIRSVASANGHLLSRLALLPDHMHIVLGTSMDESPQSVALCYMNNVCGVYDFQPVLRPSFFVGTIGEYDLGAITRADQGTTETQMCGLQES